MLMNVEMEDVENIGADIWHKGAGGVGLVIEGNDGAEWLCCQYHQN
jgi:hypothetical protein